MARIHVLDKNIAAQIAAGEVVERPASVVKELVENSIDANSSAISVDILDGGKALIRITDNGDGFESADIPIAFLRHSTSKINTEDDLNNIRTMGFRGEALYSIAAVSKINMKTRTLSSDVGTSVDVAAGRITDTQYTGCPKGTILEISDLFYNTPARLKFLKKTATESGYISSVMIRMILSHPSISFRYTNNGKQIYFSSGDGNLKNAIFAVYGKEITAAMEPIKASIDGKVLTGYIGKPSVSRSQNKFGNFFINGRYIDSPMIKRAVKDAYSTALMIGKNPIYIMNMEIDPSYYDINVHPNKLQVRFINEREIFSFVLSAVREKIFDIQSKPVEFEIPNKAVEDISIKTSSLNFSIKDEPETIEDKPKPKEFAIDKIEEMNNKILHASGSAGYDYRSMMQYSDAIAKPSNTLRDNAGRYIEIKQEQTEEKIEDLVDATIIGQLFETYILVQHGNVLYMMDQHAAHERYIYEQLMESIKKNQIVSQQLLIAQIIELTFDDELVLKENLDELSELGFTIEEYGKRSYKVSAVPYILGQIQPKEILFEILEDLKNGNDKVLKKDKIIRASCRKAVKAGDILTDLEIKHLINVISDENIPLTCPHGRPFVIKLTKKDLEKNFKRIQ